MYGSIEFGGTKIRCAVFDGDGKMLEEVRIATGIPEENMKEIGDFYKDKSIKSLGIGAFGPVDINENSKTYGYIQNTPKKNWQNYDLVGNLKKELKVPIKMVTDVAESGIGEYRKGQGVDKDSLLYITIGTGIGAAFIKRGEIINGISHAEMGHIEIAREEGDDFKSNCSFHESCFEGLCSGPALEKRLGQRAENVDISNPVFARTARYIAKALYTYSLILRPEVIIIGGGLVNNDGFIEMIREAFDKIKGSYIDLPETEKYIVKPGLGNESGLLGGYFLAKDLVE